MPIFDRESRNAAELRNIVRHQDQVVGTGNRGNLAVMGSN